MQCYYYVTSNSMNNKYALQSLIDHVRVPKFYDIRKCSDQIRYHQKFIIL